LLESLPDDVLRAARSRFHLRQLQKGEVLYTGLSAEEIQSVYFPITAVTSMVTVLSDGDCIQALPVGYEGLAGFQVIFGSARMLEQWVCAVPGSVLEMRVDNFWAMLNSCAQLGRVLLCYSQALISALAVSVACNARHSVLERCAKWVLLTHDRTPHDEFPMTHELLASLLGVRRAGITVAAANLQQVGSIHYSRGRIDVINRAALEREACECYGNISREYHRLMDVSLGTVLLPGVQAVDTRNLPAAI
jgi:CRP-like cAMP-binding protein